MKNRIQESISVLSYPKEFNVIKLSFLQDEVSTEDWNTYERIPSWFWLGPTIEKMPLNKPYRKRLCYALFDQTWVNTTRPYTTTTNNQSCIGWKHPTTTSGVGCFGVHYIQLSKMLL